MRIYYNYGWGNICDDSYYSFAEANVICHQLGYTGVSTYPRAGLTRLVLCNNQVLHISVQLWHRYHIYEDG